VSLTCCEPAVTKSGSSSSLSPRHYIDAISFLPFSFALRLRRGTGHFDQDELSGLFPRRRPSLLDAQPTGFFSERVGAAVATAPAVAGRNGSRPLLTK